MFGRCLPNTYPALAEISLGYSRLIGRLPTCYSPVRRQLAPKGSLARLACIRHTASVHPEPGSNSHSFYFLVHYYFWFCINFFFIKIDVVFVVLFCLVFKDQFTLVLNLSALLVYHSQSNMSTFFYIIFITVIFQLIKLSNRSTFLFNHNSKSFASIFLIFFECYQRSLIKTI